MLHPIETTYDGQKVFSHISPKLVRNPNVQMMATKMKLAHQKKHLFLATESPLAHEELNDLPASLNHYLFW